MTPSEAASPLVPSSHRTTAETRPAPPRRMQAPDTDEPLALLVTLTVSCAGWPGRSRKAPWTLRASGPASSDVQATRTVPSLSTETSFSESLTDGLAVIFCSVPDVRSQPHRSAGGEAAVRGLNVTYPPLVAGVGVSFSYGRGGVRPPAT